LPFSSFPLHTVLLLQLGWRPRRVSFPQVVPRLPSDTLWFTALPEQTQSPCPPPKTMPPVQNGLRQHLFFPLRGHIDLPPLYPFTRPRNAELCSTFLSCDAYMCCICQIPPFAVPLLFFSFFALTPKATLTDQDPFTLFFLVPQFPSSPAPLWLFFCVFDPLKKTPNVWPICDSDFRSQFPISFQILSLDVFLAFPVPLGVAFSLRAPPPSL